MTLADELREIVAEQRDPDGRGCNFGPAEIADACERAAWQLSNLPLVMTPDLAEILGRPNFACWAAAQALRAGGHVVAHRAESEQAAVILFLVNHYLADKANWCAKASDALQAMAKGGAA